jgi:hypothetical protein
LPKYTPEHTAFTKTSIHNPQNYSKLPSTPTTPNKKPKKQKTTQSKKYSKKKSFHSKPKKDSTTTIIDVSEPT